MFRKTTKKRPPTLRTTSVKDDDDEDDNDSNPSSVAANLKVKRTIVRASKKTITTKSSRTTAVGFGGGTDAMMLGEDDQAGGDNATDKNGPAVSTGASSSMYDQAALWQLQSEQMTYTAAVDNNESSLQLQQQQPTDTKDDETMEDFVPLDATATDDDMANVLNGEDALLLESRLYEDGAKAGLGDDGDPMADYMTAMSQEPVDQSLENDWEEQVARRAGIARPSQPGPFAAGAASHATNPTAASSATTSSHAMLEQLCGKVEATLVQLNQQQQDLQRSEEQSNVDLASTRETYSQQQADLHQSGQAVEYYQQLRVRFASWVGGLRQLQLEVQPIQQALHEIDAQMACIQRRREWENDMIAVLHHYNLLDQVLGRQPDPTIYQSWTAVTVDEFGRHVESQFTMQREQRRKRLLVIEQQRGQKVRGDEPDAFLTEDEKESLRERHKALQEALDLSLSGLDEDYTSLQNLVDMFGEWKKTYREEYRQCHATLSLADLVTPLIQVELCSLNDPWDESGGYNESKWLAVIFGALESGIIDETGVERIIERAVVPSLTDLLDKSGYELLSDQQSKSITGFWIHLNKIMPASDSLVMTRLQKRTIGYIRSRLDDISIAIVKKEAMDVTSEDELLRIALSDATVGQMHRIKKTLFNLFTYWAPILGKNKDFIEIILSFVSAKVIFLLTSLQGFEQPRFEGTPVDVFQQVYQALESTGWLDDSDLMLQTLPIRAAASMYNKMEVQVC